MYSPFVASTIVSLSCYCRRHRFAIVADTTFIVTGKFTTTKRFFVVAVTATAVSTGTAITTTSTVSSKLLRPFRALVGRASTITTAAAAAAEADMPFMTVATPVLSVIEPPPSVPVGRQRPSLPLRYNNDDDEDDTTVAGTLSPQPSRQQQPKKKHGLDLSTLSNHITEVFEQKRYVYEMSRDIQNSIQSIRNQNIGTDEAHAEIQQLLYRYSLQSLTGNVFDNIGRSEPQSGSNGMVLSYDKATNRTPRIANLSYTVEDLIRTISYQHFLQTGTILPPPPYVTDEEYLSGAIMGLCSDLQHYGLGRATVRDVASVRMAGTVVSACMEYLLSFDFRNGPLRRKYDGCKYSLKALETFQYELAVTSPTPMVGDGATTTATTTIDDILPMKELIALKERMEFRDELRETLIKKCRDGQKLAKQCIFALHRNPTDHTTPHTILQQCCSYIQTDLLPIVQEEPPLRYGSYASVLEEYVEAKLFYTWLHGRDCDTTDPVTTTSSNTNGTTSDNRDTSGQPVVNGTILVPEDFMRDDFLQLEPEEYIGGLCDLTGEIGRYAVQRGTVRDVVGIKQCLSSNTMIYNAIQSMDRISSSGSGTAYKKMDTVRNSVQKIERMLYEISLSEAAGHGRIIHTDAPPIVVASSANEDE